MPKRKIIIISNEITKEKLEKEYDYSMWTLDYSETWFNGKNWDVAHKLELLYSQIQMRDGIFINTIFPLLSKLKKAKNPLYSKISERVSGFLHLHRSSIWILMYKPDPSEKGIMQSMNLRYAEFNTEKELKQYMIRLIKRCHH